MCVAVTMVVTMIVLERQVQEAEEVSLGRQPCVQGLVRQSHMLTKDPVTTVHGQTIWPLLLSGQCRRLPLPMDSASLDSKPPVWVQPPSALDTHELAGLVITPPK